MRQLLYVSHVVPGITPAALDNILTTSRASNALLDVTGLLVFIAGGFLHLLEGEERPLRELYARIAADNRHRDARLLLDRESSRVFTGSPLAFECPSLDDPQTAGMFGVAREAIEGRLSPGTGRIVALMLETFYRVHREDMLAVKAS